MMVASWSFNTLYDLTKKQAFLCIQPKSILACI